MNRFIVWNRALALVLKALIIVFLSAACSSETNDAERAALNKGGEAYKRGDMQEAIKQLTLAIKIDPKNENAYGIRGAAYHNLSDYSNSIADFNQAIRINPNNAASHYNRGVAYYKLGDTSKAIADWTQTIKIDPNYADAYSFRGGVYATLKDYKSATKDARRACELGACGLLVALISDKLIYD